MKSHEKLPASKGHKGLKCGGKVKKMAEGGIVPGSAKPCDYFIKN